MAFIEMLKKQFAWDEEFFEDEVVEEQIIEQVESNSFLDRFKARKSEKIDSVEEKHLNPRSYSNQSTSSKVRQEPKVVSINANSEGVVANIRLTRFEEVKKVTTHLKLNRIVIADLNNLEVADGQRALDFICGAVEAINADIQRAGSVGSLYILTPNGMCTVGDENDEFRYKGVFPWIKN